MQDKQSNPLRITQQKTMAQNQFHAKSGVQGGWQDLWGGSKFLISNTKLIFVALAGFLIGLYSGYATLDIPIIRQPEPQSMSACVSDTLQHYFSEKNSASAETLQYARDHCYSLIHSQGLISDFDIRKLVYFQQYRANGALMWMVIIVTFSGVLLSALQLFASYRLAAANRTALPAEDAQIILKHDELALKSSVTGLFILLISLCFFLVFVRYVYKIDPVAEQGTTVQVSPLDGLGPPLSEKEKK
jgi:hypothetical protein